MNYFYAFCMFGVLFNLFENVRTETRGPTWGNISGSFLFQDRVTKNKIPFFTRSVTFEYPVVCNLSHSRIVLTK